MRLISELHNVMTIVEYIALFLATFGVALSMVVNEIKYNRPMPAVQENLFMMYVALSNVMLSVTHVLRY